MIKPHYKLKLRAIDNGTRYDVSGKLKQLARQVERGEHGDVRDAVVVIREKTRTGGERIGAWHFGTGTIADALLTLEAGKSKIVG